MSEWTNNKPKKLSTPKARRVKAILTLNTVGKAQRRFLSPVFSVPTYGESNSNMPPFDEWEELPPDTTPPEGV